MHITKQAIATKLSSLKDQYQYIVDCNELIEQFNQDTDKYQKKMIRAIEEGNKDDFISYNNRLTQLNQEKGYLLKRLEYLKSKPVLTVLEYNNIKKDIEEAYINELKALDQWKDNALKLLDEFEH